MLCLFRVDANAQIGFGHAMRCLTLAKALKEKGAECAFISRPLPESFDRQLVESGIDHYELMESVPDPANPFSLDLLADAEQTFQIVLTLNTQCPVLLVVDHYGIDIDWERAVLSEVDYLVAMDDQPNRPHECHLLIDQTLDRREDEYRAWVPDHCRVLAGSQYALLRPEFAALRQQRVDTKPDADPSRLNVLINFGGGQHTLWIERTLSVMSENFGDKALNLHIVGIAPDAPELQQPWPACWQLDARAHVGDMAELMCRMDFAIGAAGSSAWERCCLGLPSILLVLADNQRDIAQALARRNAALPVNSEAFGASLRAALVALFDAETRTRMREAAWAVCDGEGVARTLSALVALDAWQVSGG